ncbi:valine--tRNA ligase [Egicoccus sp. AB-alg2]|uniref:valine--tRNA ligase n=1 Tax=Egicoccus sp. AB-alg2 TaxID=3242693 RepID=UPI00359CDA17
MSELPKAYDPAAVEPELYDDWLRAGLFHAEPDGSTVPPHGEGAPYSIVIPPPNVTGSLHIGHALDNSIQDVLIRRARMQGRNAVWIPGTDHAGIATQNVVEKQLAAEGTDRHALGREAFVERTWQWREESGGMILRQLRKLGASCDWEREAFTFDDTRSRAVREVFVTLYEQGLIYRGNRLINWCPRCHTALSDIEVEHEETVGELARFRYPLVPTDADPEPGFVEVATTRAETMLGDTAIAVHPDDERYRALVGRQVHHPFQDRTLPIVADDYVDPEFGSGAVKITPAHDPNDYAIAQRHDLQVIDIMDDAAALTDVVGERFAGLDRFDARREVKTALDELGLLVGVEPHTHAVGHCERCKTVVEPRLSDQWFVAVRPLAEKAAQAIRDGRTVFVPESRTKPFLEWLDNLHDWCISRQIWWGHRIPAWYGPDGQIEVSRTDLDREGWVQDEDVLDTWFSSQLWPFTTMGWEGPDTRTPEFETWFPTSVLVTGYDINTFWVSRMLMISLWLHDEVPFRVVHNHGLVRDEFGKKMSKSFGNVIDPLDLVDKYGADATRFALLRSAAPGTDVPMAEEWVEGAKRFANKLWNAGRFALSNLDGTRPDELPPPASFTLEDRWILSRLEAVRAEVDAAYDAYDWPVVSRTLYHFAWDELADWYLEAVKVRLYGDDPAAAEVARQVLAVVLDDLLRLLAPVMPFVTEALWRALTGAEGGSRSLMVAPWPQARATADPEAERDFAVLQDLVTEVRKFRSQNGIAPSARFAITLATHQRAVIEAQEPLVTALAGLSELRFVDALEERAGTSTIVFAAGSAQVELAGLIDVAAELGRLEKELARAEGELARVEGKLGNTAFVERAPADVVAREQARREDLHVQIGQLQERVDALSAMSD